MKIIKEIVAGSGYQIISLNLFDNLDKDTAFKIYNFLSKYKFILHLDPYILEKVREIVLHKYDNVLLYKLNPSISDLLNNNVYKLFVDNELYLVPLWYNELYFDCGNSEIIVICDPELPDGIKIDDDNNIYVETELLYKEITNLILENRSIGIIIGENTFEIPISELYMKCEQYYRIKNKGLSKIKSDIYDISEKADIIIKINLV